MNHVSLKNNGTPYSSGIVISKPLGVGSRTKENWDCSTTEAVMLKSRNDQCHTQSIESSRLSTLEQHLPYYRSSAENISAHSKVMEDTQSSYSAESEEVNLGKKKIQKSNICSILPSSYWSHYQRFPLRAFSATKDSTQNLTVMSDLSHRTETYNGIGFFIGSTPPGLINPGNSCFVNSILQCLTWTPGFFGLLSNLPSDHNNDESIFLNNLKTIVGQSRSFPDGRTSICTDKLLLSMSFLAQHLVASANNVQHQQDAAEFLLWLLNYLHCVNPILSRDSSCHIYSEKRTRDLKMSKRIDEERINAIGSKDIQRLEAPMMDLSKVDWELHCQEHSSALNDLFMGQLLEALECQSCNKVTMSSEYFTLLPLPLSKNGSSLTECISMFSKAEELLKDNMIRCTCLQRGSLTNATRLALLSVVPKCLVIQLTRFSYDSSKHIAVKNSTTVRIIIELEIFPYTMKAKFNSKHQQSMLYNLHAVCLHSGAQSTSCGHYVAYCRVRDDQWYHFNDDVVTPITDIKGELNSEFVLRNAYILLYHRVD